MSHPKLMMMDEPSLGPAPLIVRNLFDIIREINKQGTTSLHLTDKGWTEDKKWIEKTILKA